MEDGGLRMEDRGKRGKRIEDGGWRMEERGRKGKKPVGQIILPNIDDTGGSRDSLGIDEVVG